MWENLTPPKSEMYEEKESSLAHSHFTADTLYMLQIRGGGGGFGV